MRTTTTHSKTFRAILSAAICAALGSALAQSIPEHTIAEKSVLSNGLRIQINVDDAELSREQCTTLIEAYRDNARPEGQVSVHKPSKLLVGQVLPYCVENFDGSGINFNTGFHPEG